MRVKDFKDDRFKTKIAELFSFISQPDHRIYNRELQKRYLSQILVYSGTSEKVMNHLYLTVNTQSQPKINKLADFFEEFNSPGASLKSYRDFKNFLSVRILKLTKRLTRMFSTSFEKKRVGNLKRPLYL